MDDAGKEAVSVTCHATTRAKGTKLCTLCGLPFAFFRKHARFCSSRCRQRHHRGHRSLATLRRRALHFFGGQLSDYPDYPFAS
jgi:hypothetical protein